MLAGGAAARDRKVAAEYDRLAERYAEVLGDELDGKSFDRWLLARLAAEASGSQGLDVGCGPGYGAGFLADHGVVMTGLDLSPNMVAAGASAGTRRTRSSRATSWCRRCPGEVTRETRAGAW